LWHGHPGRVFQPQTVAACDLKKRTAE
jgi:hypothetical protein